jgi:hypothetical protein
VAATAKCAGIFLGLIIASRTGSNVPTWPGARSNQRRPLALANVRTFRVFGVPGSVAFADPLPRWRTTGPRPELIKPGHVGIVYQALCGRGCALTIDRP